MSNGKLRRRSVLGLARRCRWHQTHSEQVARLCVMLFDELRPVHGLGAAERELIEYAALLHDIGWHIAAKGHHKHSMRLIHDADLAGFTPAEVQMIANIARYHRKAMPKATHHRYQELAVDQRRVVDVGGALLRIADGLDRGHASVVRGLRCDVGSRKIVCTLAAIEDAEVEIRGAMRKMDLFEKVFGRKMSIRPLKQE